MVKLKLQSLSVNQMKDTIFNHGRNSTLCSAEMAELVRAVLGESRGTCVQIYLLCASQAISALHKANERESVVIRLQREYINMEQHCLFMD